MREHDGNFSYSTLMQLKNNREESISISPNPVQTTAKLLVPKKYIHTLSYLIDLNGNPVRSFYPESSENQIDLTGLASGVYVLRMVDGSGVKVMKQY